MPYIGGEFTAIGNCNLGSGIAINAVTGSIGMPLRTLMPISGTVNAVAPDASGRWYIGGTFSISTPSLTVQNLAHVHSDGSIANWAPNPDHSVETIAPFGSTIYVAGGFTSVGGQPRHGLAAIGPDGSALSWNPAPPTVKNPSVRTAEIRQLAVNNDILYVGGYFDDLAGQQRSNLAAFDASGSLTSWNPSATLTNLSYHGEVFSFAFSGDIVLVGGSFDRVGGKQRSGLAAIDSNANATDWNPDVSGLVPWRGRFAVGRAAETQCKNLGLLRADRRVLAVASRESRLE